MQDVSAETITSVEPDSTTPSSFTLGDSMGGGAGRGGSENGAQGPLVVVQQPRNAAPPRPAPNRSQGNTDNSLRNGYAALSHSVSGETAAIGVGFLVAGPVGAIVGGVAGPALAAAVMWRSRRREHDDNTNRNSASTGSPSRSPRNSDRGNGARNTGSRNTPGGGRNHTPNGRGNGTTGPGGHRKPKVKDPVADKLSKLGKGLADKFKNNDKTNKAPKNSKRDRTDRKGATDPKGRSGKNPKAPKNSDGTKDTKDGSKSGQKLKGRSKQPPSDRPWTGRGSKDKNTTKGGKGAGATSSTARDALVPKTPKGGGSTNGDGIIDAEIVDDGLPPKPHNPPSDIIDVEVIDEDRIALVRQQREKKRRRQAVAAGKAAAQQAARDGNTGDPHRVKTEVIRQHNHHIDLALHNEDQLLALAAAAENPRSTPVNYPAIQSAPAGTSTPGTAIARQIDFRTSVAYAILRAMADQLAHGLHSDDDADMADHIIELTGIPNMCKNLSIAVQEAGRALAKTAPLHPSVIKHLNNAAVAARTAGVMSESIMVVFVQAHRADIIRVLDPRIGEERWNIRNAPGTLDAAKLRAAIASAHAARLALPSGNASGVNQKGGSKLVPASDASTRKLVNLMKGFGRGHMVTVLSEVAGSAVGVEVVADSINKLYRRMTKTWPTENIVDDTVLRTAGQVRRVSEELMKAIKAAQKAHQRELRLNAKGRNGKGARAERKWDVAAGRGSSE
ncbi:hypothetical protein ACFVS9_28290 [Streptomyces sp. NPDC058008]|uniref:hypothetical protein n=1 Tax=Streptomyces sp. NPDC058008 TaxID=3346303 RepID=UPI0036E876CD